MFQSRHRKLIMEKRFIGLAISFPYLRTLQRCATAACQCWALEYLPLAERTAYVLIFAVKRGARHALRLQTVPTK